MKKTTKEKWISNIKSIIWALIIALFLRTFVVEAFKIPSGSMIPTLLIGDHLFVEKFAYGIKLPIIHVKIIPIGEPKHDDIVVFRYPVNPSIYFIKRIIGVPGDTLQMINKRLYRNGKPVNESFVQHTDDQIDPPNMPAGRFGSRDNWGPIIVPKKNYFVMGDNRDESYDSRFWGYVPEKNLVGKALFIYFSDRNGDPFSVRWKRIFKSLIYDPKHSHIG